MAASDGERGWAAGQRDSIVVVNGALSPAPRLDSDFFACLYRVLSVFLSVAVVCMCFLYTEESATVPKRVI